MFNSKSLAQSSHPQAASAGPRDGVGSESKSCYIKTEHMFCRMKGQDGEYRINSTCLFCGLDPRTQPCLGPCTGAVGRKFE
jgi:hypothetical protein